MPKLTAAQKLEENLKQLSSTFHGLVNQSRRDRAHARKAFVSAAQVGRDFLGKQRDKITRDVDREATALEKTARRLRKAGKAKTKNLGVGIARYVSIAKTGRKGPASAAKVKSLHKALTDASKKYGPAAPIVLRAQKVARQKAVKKIVAPLVPVGTQLSLNLATPVAHA